jgi:acyl carrier protein
MPDSGSTVQRLKQIIVTSLNLQGVAPESIDDHASLKGDGLGLDSVDMLELIVHIEKEFGVRILSEDIDRQVFASVASLAGYLDGRRDSPTAASP